MEKEPKYVPSSEEIKNTQERSVGEQIQKLRDQYGNKPVYEEFFELYKKVPPNGSYDDLEKIRKLFEQDKHQGGKKFEREYGPAISRTTEYRKQFSNNITFVEKHCPKIEAIGAPTLTSYFESDEEHQRNNTEDIERKEKQIRKLQEEIEALKK